MAPMTAVAPSVPFNEQQHLVMRDISWPLYEQLLREVGNQPLRMTFADGSLEIMSPLPRHEKWKSRIGRMIEIVSLERNIPVEPLGSSTFRREDIAKGLEPDESYYVQHAQMVRGKDEFDLTVDPPPDLAVEVDITSRSIQREPIYAALGVPELWRFDGRLEVLRLGADGRYRSSQDSAVFPFLPMSVFETFLLRLEREEQTAVMREFRDWVNALPPLPPA